MDPGLTPMRRRVLNAMAIHYRAHGAWPTLAEIADAIGRSTPTVLEHLCAMERVGLAARRPKVARGWSATDAGMRHVESTQVLAECVRLVVALSRGDTGGNFAERAAAAAHAIHGDPTLRGMLG